jgi:hypothetical protein
MTNRTEKVSFKIKLAALAMLLISIACIPSCKKDQGVSSVPSITFDSISPNPAIKYRDSVLIVISYIDGDGDLGIDSADVKNLFVTDSRNNVVSQFRIPQLAPTGADVAIEGNLDIVLPPQLFINDNDTTETATYSIYVVDRAGHKSNTVTTKALVINL